MFNNYSVLLTKVVFDIKDYKFIKKNTEKWQCVK